LNHWKLYKAPDLLTQKSDELLIFASNQIFKDLRNLTAIHIRKPLQLPASKGVLAQAILTSHPDYPCLKFLGTERPYRFYTLGRNCKTCRFCSLRPADTFGPAGFALLSI
jgi:hypothetical protein